MEFTFPQFIEKEPKIVGPLTLKQSVFVILAVAICFLLYFSLPFAVFVVAAVLIGTCAFALAFLKINGLPFTSVIKNFFIFTLKPKIYLWKKGQIEMQIQKEEPAFVPPRGGTPAFDKSTTDKTAGREKSGPKLTTKSQLGNLFTKIETKQK